MESRRRRRISLHLGRDVTSREYRLSAAPAEFWEGIYGVSVKKDYDLLIIGGGTNRVDW